MSEFETVKTFVELAKRAVSVRSVSVHLKAALQQLGFDYHALGHHVDLQLPPENAIRIVEYPQAWFERVLERRYFVDDPVLMAVQRSATGFFWHEVPRLVNLSSRQRHILDQAAVEGLGPGYTAPVHVPGEYFGSIHLAVRSGRTLPEEAIPAAQYAATFAFEAARRLQLRKAGLKSMTAPPLSPRQRDCLTLAAKGLSDKEIARNLGIRPHTARQYLGDAMRLYGSSRRAQLIVRALFEGEIVFNEVIGAPLN